jgi:hypothetical protein
MWTRLAQTIRDHFTAKYNIHDSVSLHLVPRNDYECLPVVEISITCKLRSGDKVKCLHHKIR